MTQSASYRIILNRMGYYNYQHGLIYRHLGQEGGWDTHLQNCRSFIIKAVDLVKPSTVTVLGSGWLLDLPFREIAERVSKINLVDIVHPPELKNQITEIRNTELIEEDITGGLIEEVWQKTGGRSVFSKHFVPSDIEIPVYQPGYETGMVISLNILTQLESLPVIFLKKKSGLDGDHFLQIREKIQKSHMDFLMKHSSVLITDTAEVFSENSGNIKTVPTVIINLPKGKISEEWTWYFELKNRDYYHQKSVFRVSANLY